MLANFDSKKLILMKIKVRLIEFWKSLIILNEIKKLVANLCAFGRKNQLRFEIFEETLKFT